MSRATCCGLLAVLCLWEPTAGEEACKRDTGGGCNIEACFASRGPTVCQSFGMFNHKCLCQEGYCAHEGACVRQGSPAPTPATTPAPAPAAPTPAAPTPATPTPAPPTQDECTLAYSHRCYAEEPFKSCCNEGACQSAKGNLTCHWGFEMPCCQDLFDAKFDLTPGSELDCQKACNAMGDKRNNYLDFCPAGRLENLPEVKACPAALASLKEAVGTVTWCSSHRQLTCKWKYSRFLKQQDSIQEIAGSFNFADDSTSNCINACQALGNPSNEPKEYCGDSALSDALGSCQEAMESYTGAHATWCSNDEAGEVFLAQGPVAHHEISPVAQEPIPQELAGDTSPDVNALFNECHSAFKDQCWNREPFAGCCETCSSASASHTCAWQFEYMGVQIGETVKSFPGEVWDGCDQACEILGDPHAMPKDYCGGRQAVVVHKISECKQAVASFEKLKPPWSWCETTTSAPTAPPVAFSAATGPSSSGLIPTLAAVAAGLALTAAVAVKLRSRSRAGQDGYQPFLE